MNENNFVSIGDVPESYKKRGIRRPFTDKDMDKLINRIDEKYIIDDDYAKYSVKNGMMFKALLVLLFRTGARVGELVRVPNSKAKKSNNFYGLTFGDIQFSDELITIAITTEKYRGKKKGQKRRAIFLQASDKYMGYFLAWYNKANTGKENDVIFPMDRIRAWRRLKEIAIECGIEPDHFWLHYLRSSCFSHLVAEGINSYALQARAGWSSIQMADKYVADMASQEALKQWTLEQMRKEKHKEESSGKINTTTSKEQNQSTSNNLKINNTVDVSAFRQPTIKIMQKKELPIE